MEKQRSSSRRKMHIPQKNIENFTPEQDLVLERLVSNFFLYMDGNALRERAIRNIQDKIAIIENAEQISKFNKRKGRNYLATSFQNSLGCVVRMSDDYNILSSKPLPITNLNRKKKPLKLSRQISQDCNKNSKRLEGVQKLCALNQKLENEEKSLKLARQISQHNKDHKRIKRLQEISVCQKKLSKLSKQISRHNNKNYKIESAQDLPALNQNLKIKDRLLGPVHSTHIKIPVVKLVPLESLGIADKLWKQKFRQKKQTHKNKGNKRHKENTRLLAHKETKFLNGNEKEKSKASCT